MNLEIAQKLVEQRKKHGYSQEALAEQLGVSRQAVSKWERAEASPDTDNLIALSRLYQISLDELVGKSTASGAQSYKNSGATDEYFESESYAESESADGSFAKEDAHQSGVNGTYNDDKSDEGFCFIDDDGSTVNIGLGGIHVKDGKNKDEVHIDKHGIHIFENGHSSHMHCDADDKCSTPSKHTAWETAFDSVCCLLCVTAYLLMGFLADLWHPGWLVLVMAPVLPALIKPSRWEGVFPLVVIGAYLLMGFLADLWHPGWVIFFAIPAFYAIWNAIKNAVKSAKSNKSNVDAQ